MSEVTDRAAPAAAAAGQLPQLARFACDTDNLMSPVATDFIRVYADLVGATSELDALQRRFPDSTIELINRGLGDPLGLANIYDVEPGALSPDQAAMLLRQAHTRGERWQVVYSDRNDLPAVIEACQGLSYWHWIAAPGELVVPGHEDAQIQFAFAQSLGVHLDLSIIWNPAYRPSTAARAAALAPAPAAHAGLAELAALPAVSALAGVPKLSEALPAALDGNRHALEVVARDLQLAAGLINRHADLLVDVVPELARFV